MMITRATEYASLTMLYLAKQPAGKLSYTAEIAEAEHIPPAFLVKVIPRLVKAGLVVSRRGSSGGIELAKDPKTVTLRHVLEAMEGEVAANVCTSSQPYQCHKAGCSLKGVFAKAQAQYLEALDSVTLSELAGLGADDSIRSLPVGSGT
ncbi:HTH-type transcriptional repressor NsrR [compost metagenome]